MKPRASGLSCQCSSTTELQQPDNHQLSLVPRLLPRFLAWGGAWVQGYHQLSQSFICTAQVVLNASNCTSSSHSEYASVCFCLMMVKLVYVQAFKSMENSPHVDTQSHFVTVDFNSPSLNTVVVHSSIPLQVEIIQSTTSLISHKPCLIYL